MFEDLAAEHGIDAVAGMQDQVLTRPGQRTGEQQEHHQPEPDDVQGAHGLMHDHLVDHDLGEDRRGQCENLDHKRGGEHVPPDFSVLEEFGDKPVKPELGFGQVDRVGIFERCVFRREMNVLTSKALFELFALDDLRHLAGAREVLYALGVNGGDQHQFASGRWGHLGRFTLFVTNEMGCGSCIATAVFRID